MTDSNKEKSIDCLVNVCENSLSVDSEKKQIYGMPSVSPHYHRPNTGCTFLTHYDSEGYPVYR